MSTLLHKKLHRLTNQLNSILKNDFQQEDGGYYEIQIKENKDKLLVKTQYWAPRDINL